VLRWCTAAAGVASLSAAVQRAGGSTALPGDALDDALEQRAAYIEVHGSTLSLPYDLLGGSVFVSTGRFTAISSKHSDNHHNHTSCSSLLCVPFTFIHRQHLHRHELKMLTMTMLQGGAGGEAISMGFGCLPEDAPAVLAMFADVVQSPALPPQRIELYKAQVSLAFGYPQEKQWHLWTQVLNALLHCRT
jgi:hypothetical protein